MAKMTVRDIEQTNNPEIIPFSQIPRSALWVTHRFIKCSSLEQSNRGVKFTRRHAPTTLKMSGTINLLPLHILVAWAEIHIVPARI